MVYPVRGPVNRPPRHRYRPAVAIALAVLAAISVAPSAAAAHAAVAAPATGVGVAGTALPASEGRVTVAPAAPGPTGAVALGSLPAATELAVAVGLASRDPAGLAAYDAALETPGSPEYRHPLSAAVADERFGAPPTAVREAERYFAGLGIGASAGPDGLILSVSGPSGAIARAFGTTFEEYRLAGGRIAFSHPGPAVLPAIAPWTGAYGLGNLTQLTPSVEGVPADPAPAATCSSGTYGLLPCTIETAYNISSLLDDGVDGSGERIAVVDAYSSAETQPTLESDLAAFASTAGISVGDVSYLYPVPTHRSLNTSGTNPLWGLEEALDLEWARAIAPGAAVEMVFSPNSGPGLYEAIDWLVAHRATDVISMSWGEPDVGVYDAATTSCPSGCNATTDGSYAVLGPVLELAAAEGISLFAASGDCGSADGTAGVATNFPASDPYVTGVGGTNLELNGNDYSSETAWSGNESGRSESGCENTGGSGGGYAPTPRPWWQVGLPAGTTGRGVPDVALDAATPVEIRYEGSPTAVEGTSVGTPIWAGIAALADQSAGADLGLLDPSLYRILGSPEYATDFHDIVSGTNGYHARVGWDPVTGVGTPIVDALVPDLARGGALAGGGLATYLSAGPQEGAAPLTVAFRLSASGGTGTYPLEGVSFGDSNSSLTTTGSVNYTYATPGVYLAQSFVADSSGNESVSPPLPIVVGGGGPLSVSLVASTETPAAGANVTFTASATGGTGPYTYDFWFGDGASVNGSAATVAHAFPAAGLFCAVVVARDSASPPDGGASPAVEMEVGGASGPACGYGSGPLTVTPLPNPGVRDAPADFPDLFSVSGGATGNGEPPPTVTLASNDPYTAACECTIFRAGGNYTVRETVTDAADDVANGTANITVAPRLAATFTASTLAGPVPLTVTFHAAATGGYRASASDTVWAFGPPGATAVGAGVSYTYDTPGEYVATALLGDAGDGNASESFLLDAEPATGAVPPGAVATISPSEDLESGTTVAFSAAPEGTPAPAALFWELGGSAGSAGATANETYFAPPAGDVLDVGLVVEGPGFVPAATVPIDLASFLAEPSAGFVPAADDLRLGGNVTPTFGEAPLAVGGNASASGAGGASLAWTVGGAGVGTGPRFADTIGTPGNFTVVVRASDPFGDTAVRSAPVSVVRPLSVSGGPSPTSGGSPLRVAYSVRASGGTGGPFDYRWTFGNGRSANGSTGAVRYARPGTYEIHLLVEDGFGDQIERNWTVSVGLPDLFLYGILAAGGAVGVAMAIVLGGPYRRAGERRD